MIWVQCCLRHCRATMKKKGALVLPWVRNIPWAPCHLWYNGRHSEGQCWLSFGLHGSQPGVEEVRQHVLMLDQKRKTIIHEALQEHNHNRQTSKPVKVPSLENNKAWNQTTKLWKKQGWKAVNEPVCVAEFISGRMERSIFTQVQIWGTCTPLELYFLVHCLMA